LNDIILKEGQRFNIIGYFLANEYYMNTILLFIEKANIRHAVDYTSYLL